MLMTGYFTYGSSRNESIHELFSGSSHVVVLFDIWNGRWVFDQVERSTWWYTGSDKGCVSCGALWKRMERSVRQSDKKLCFFFLFLLVWVFLLLHILSEKLNGMRNELRTTSHLFSLEWLRFCGQENGKKRKMRRGMGKLVNGWMEGGGVLVRVH